MASFVEPCLVLVNLGASYARVNASAFLLVKGFVDQNRSLTTQVSDLQRQLDAQHQDADGLQRLHDGVICECHPVCLCMYMLDDPQV